jgi:hypothetical protein
MAREIRHGPVYLGVLVAVTIFFGLSFVTNPIHDHFFLAHSSIQNGVEVCTPYDPGDCDYEDGVLAYNNLGWAILGNTFALFMTVLRLGTGCLAYRMVVAKLGKK